MMQKFHGRDPQIVMKGYTLPLVHRADLVYFG